MFVEKKTVPMKLKSPFKQIKKLMIVNALQYSPIELDLSFLHEKITNDMTFPTVPTTNMGKLAVFKILLI